MDKKKIDYISKIIIVVCLVIAGYSGVKIVSMLTDSAKINKEVKTVTSVAKITKVIDTEKPERNESREDLYWKFLNEDYMNVDLNKLSLINEDTVGWIKVSGTNINYPFVQTADNKYYLTHSFYRNKNYAGWVFMDYRNSKDLDNENTIIYAHGRADETMFGSLKRTLKPSWYENPDNYLIYISTKDSNSIWQVFSSYKIETTSDYIQTNFGDLNLYKNFLNKLKERSVYNYPVELSEEDKILTLSKCYNEAEKVVVHAKLIKQMEK